MNSTNGWEDPYYPGQERTTEVAQQEEQSDAPQQTDLYEAYWERQRKIILSAGVTLSLVAANLIVYLVEIFGKRTFYEGLALDTSVVAAGAEQYRLLTAMFMHASIPHLVSNMVILLLIGAAVEGELGHLPYAVIYLVSGLIGNMLTVWWDVMLGDPTWSVGASGAVFGIIGAVVVIFIRERKQLRGRRGLALRLGLMVFYSLFSGFGQTEINNAAHVGGFLAGTMFSTLYTLLARKRYHLDSWL